jgi:osmotically-inducible protein OsmY
MRTDEQIRNDIIKQLQWDNRINSSDINVEVDQHIATLSGSVNSYMQKKSCANGCVEHSRSIRSTQSTQNHK